MSGKDMLSQEEIDALLRQSAIGKPAASNDIYDYLTPIEIDTLGEIGNISFGNASTALSSLLRQKVDITTPKVDLVLKEDLEKEFPVPYVSVHVRYTEGLQGDNLLVLRAEDAKIIADLMLGGDGTNPQDLGELELSACGEAMNQMMGSAATSLAMFFNKAVNISPPNVNILDIASGKGAENLPEEENLIRVSFRLKVGNLIDSTIMQLIPVSFAKEIVQMLLEGQKAQENGAEAVAQTAAVAERNPVEQDQNRNAHSSRLAEEIQTPSPQPQNAPQFLGTATGRTPNVQQIQFASFENSSPPSPANEINLNLLLDIPLQVTVELGRTKKMIKEILELSPGSIIELDKLAGEPVDILVNNKLVAKGEVVVIEENFGVRVTEIISQWDRLQKLQ